MAFAFAPERAVSPKSGAKPDAEVLDEADRLDLEHEHPLGPQQGFGKLWRKRHRTPLTGVDVSPEHVVTTWKERFGEFWPGDNRIYGPITALEPGELAVINLEMPGQVTLSSGVILVDSQPASFTLVTPKGHMFAGLLTFSAYRKEGTTFAQAEMLIRASDPLFEIGMVLFGHRQEDRFWRETMRNVAAHWRVYAKPESLIICEDKRYQWSRIGNIRHNGFIRNLLVRIAALASRLSGRITRKAA
jgi:hypothetical protein